MSKAIGEAMYGVVLWSDRHKNCAVIWCEDHRNLAFYRNDQHAPKTMNFGPGDLVEFDVREEDDLRLALDPSVVGERQYVSLAGDLMKAGAQRTETSLPGEEKSSSDILTLFPNRTRSNARDQGSASESALDTHRKFG